MNTINVEINFTKGTNKLTGINLITGDYASTKMVFQFDRTDGRKVLEMKNPSGDLVYLGEIQNNEVLLCAVEDDLNYSIFNQEGRYIYEVSLYNGDSKLTSVKGELPVQKEQVIIDGEVIEPYLPYFDQLMQELNTAIGETNNLNVSASKVDTTTTITITKKDGTTYDVQVLDGEKGDKGDKGDAGAIKMLIVAELPSTGADDTIYLVPIPKIEVESLPSTGEPKTIYIVIGTGKRYIYESEQWLEVTNDNNYFEYVYINNKWEELGEIGVEVDLTDYVKNTDYATDSKGGVIKYNSLYGTYVGTTGLLSALNKTYAQYGDMYNNGFIGKGTLENVITGKGLVSNTNYASDSTGGVIKTGWAWGTAVNSSGQLYCSNKTYAQYSGSDNAMFISKGTLENVLTNRIGDIQTLLDNLDTGSGV